MALDAVFVVGVVNAYDLIAALIVALLCLIVRRRIRLTDSIISQPKQVWKWLIVSFCVDLILIFVAVATTLTMIAPTVLSTSGAILYVLRLSLFFSGWIQVLRLLVLVAIWTAEGVIGFKR